MFEILIPIILLGVGAFFGTQAQKKHIETLNQKEADLSHILVTNIKTMPAEFHSPKLVTGSTVIAFDYFRRFIAGFVMLIGGRITMYETMLDRARRQALVRLLEEAEQCGARAVYNIRFEFSRIGSSGGKAQIGGGAELLAYGTAVK